MKRRNTFSKKERLKSRKQIERLFSTGKTINLYPYRIRFLQVTDRSLGTSIQTGVAVSRKLFKKAVHRNRIKRLTREAFRLQKLPLQQKLEASGKQIILFFIFTGKVLPEYALVKDKLGLIMEKLIRTVDETDRKNS